MRPDVLTKGVVAWCAQAPKKQKVPYKILQGSRAKMKKKLAKQEEEVRISLSIYKCVYIMYLSYYI
jgi:hypothetical protein